NQARQRGIRIIIDLVINHTSDQHPWFKSARKDKNSKYRDWYVWSKKRPRDYRKGVVFPGVQQATWSFDKVAREWYYHRFYDFHPDLTSRKWEGRAELQRSMGFWLGLGVPGCRVAAVPFVMEAGVAGDNYVRHYAYLSIMRDFLQWREGDAILLGEANVVP